MPDPLPIIGRPDDLRAPLQRFYAKRARVQRESRKFLEISLARDPSQIGHKRPAPFSPGGMFSWLNCALSNVALAEAPNWCDNLGKARISLFDSQHCFVTFTA
jgi:hypothetical protein